MSYSSSEVELINKNPFLRTGEGQILKFILAKLPENPIILEIGTFKGRTAILMAKARPDAVIITIDPHVGIPEHPEISSSPEEVIRNIAEENVVSQIIHHVRSSQEYVPTSLFDFIFIDGGHTYKDVKFDFIKFKDYCRKDGYIAFHDYGINHHELTGVTKFCDSLNVQKNVGGTIFFFQKCQLKS